MNNDFNFISTKGGSLTSQYSKMFGTNSFIHRKNKGNRVRFNPQLKNNFKGFYVGYTVRDNKLYMVIQREQINPTGSWKIPARYSTVPTFCQVIDNFFKTKSNRYKLVFDRELGNESYLFTIELAEEVNERTADLSEEDLDRLNKQLEKGRITRDKNREERETEDQEQEQIQEEPVEIS